jgi:hypothetical protein
MSALSDRFTSADRQRLAELRELDELVRQPGTLAGPGTGQDDTPDRGTE